MTREITNLVNARGDPMTVLNEADPADKAEVYQQLGLTLTYDPAARRVKAEAGRSRIMYVGKCPRTERTQNQCILTREFHLGRLA